MQTKSPTHKINAQLEKLNKLMQEQFQFNQKYILKALQSTGSNNSQYDQDGLSQNDQNIFEQHHLSKITNRNVLPYQFFASENNNYAQLEIQYQEKAFPTAFQKNQAKCWQKNNRIQKFIPFQAQLDQQLTTKSISYSYEGQTKLQLNSLFHQDTLEDEDRLTVLKVCTRNNEKQNLNTQNNVTKKEKEKSSKISDSAISTTQIFQGSFHKQIQRKRKQEYKPFNQSIKVKDSTKKILIKNIDNNKQLQKQKRPITSTKVPNNLQKQEKFQLNNLKKLKQESIQSKQKKLTNRNTKTQRQKLQIEVGTKLLKNPSRCNLQQNKKRGNNFSKKSKIQKRIIKHQPFTVVSNLNKFSQKNKTWQKSAQKTVKKLNKVNLTKLNDNLKQQAKKVDLPLGSNHKNQYLNNKISENKMINIYKNLTNTKGQIRYGNDLNANIEKQKQENNLKFKQDKNIVEKLDFNSKIPIMQRMIQRKKIFKYYTLMANNYIESSQKLNTKYFKQLQLQIKEMQDKGLYIFKIIKAIAVFFSQFFRPTKKNVMGMIAKCTQDQQILNLWENANLNRGSLIQKQILIKKQADFRKTKFSNFNISKTLILALLDKPKDLVNNILTLPSYLYNCNILSQNSLKKLLNQYDNINQIIDRDGDLQLFLLKKTKIFIYFHELVQFIKFLKQYDLIQQTERRNLNIQKNMMAGYYSSRNRRKERNKSNKFNNKHMKGCDSQRKNTIQGLQTQRILIHQDMLNNLSRIKTKKQLKQQKQQKISLQKQTHMFKSRQNKIQCI